MTRWVPTLLAALVLGVLVGLLVESARKLEEVTEQCWIDWAPWNGGENDLTEKVKKLLAEGWEIDEIGGDGCGTVYVNLKRTRWRTKQ